MKQKNKEIEQPKRIYSTAIINELIKDINKGYDVDTSLFFDRDIELRAANVVFKLTAEEYEEFKKCAMDAEYFISKYCKFLTDKGRRLVTLYPHQNKIIKNVTAQHYDENIDEFVPNNRNIIIMASRQTGKCIIDAEVTTNKNKQKISSIYYKYKSKNFISKIKQFLFKIYTKL